MVIIKGIFIFFIGSYSLSKIIDGINNKYINNTDKFVNLVEIIVSVLLTFAIFKI